MTDPLAAYEYNFQHSAADMFSGSDYSHDYSHDVEVETDPIYIEEDNTIPSNFWDQLAAAALAPWDAVTGAIDDLGLRPGGRTTVIEGFKYPHQR